MDSTYLIGESMNKFQYFFVSAMFFSLVSCGDSKVQPQSSSSEASSSSPISSSQISSISSSSSSSSSAVASSSKTNSSANNAVSVPLKHFHETGGYATKIEAGLGGKVYKVTNLKKSGSGSLAEALAASGKRLVVFEVGGVINMEGSRLEIKKGDVTVAGQTAPDPGITIIRGTLKVPASNVIVSHIAVRPGDGDGGEPDGIEISGSNVVMDHVSATWAIDEGLTIKQTNNITLYKSVISQQLSESTHSKPEHSKAILIYRGSTNISLIGCLFAHNSMRNPRISDGKVLMANSVVYNWGEGKDEFRGDLEDYNFVVHLGDNGESDQVPEVSFVGNVGLSGPDSKAVHFLKGHKNEKGKAFMRDNVILDLAGNPLFESDEKIIPLDSPPIWPTGFKEQPAHESLYEVLRTVGPRPGQRSSITTEIVKSVALGNGKIIDSQKEVGGYPKYAETKRALTVPDGISARRAWLDKLEDDISVDKNIDLSRLYDYVGSRASDKLVQ